jgi:hypothetical protein
MLKKIKFFLSSRKALEFLVFIFIVISSLYFLRNLDFLEVPVSDTFQFIDDSQSYAQFNLPNKIHASPANPILIALITPLLEVDFPAVRAATSISTIAVISALIVFFFFIKRHLKNYALLLPAFIFLIFSSALFSVVWDGNSDALFGFVALLSLVIYEKNKKSAYILSALFILVRYEALAILGAFFVTDLLFYFVIGQRKFNKKNILNIRHQNWFEPALKAGLMMLIWFLFVHFHSWYNTRGSAHEHGNYYIYEIFSRINDIPNWIFFTKFSNIFFLEDWWDGSNRYAVSNSILSLFILYLFIFSLFFAIREKNKEVLANTFFIIFYLLIHVFFPATPYRYLFAVLIPSVYVLIFAVDRLIINLNAGFTGNFFKTLTFIFFLVFSIYIAQASFVEKNTFLNVVKKQGLEIKRVMVWINQQEFDEDQYVVSFEIFNHFNLNDKVKYLSAYGKCLSVQCLLHQFGIEKDIWVIKTADSQRLNDFKIKEMSALVFNNDLENSCLTALFRVDIPKLYDWENDQWAIVYNYDYEKCKNIDLGAFY